MTKARANYWLAAACLWCMAHCGLISPHCAACILRRGRGCSGECRDDRPMFSPIPTYLRQKEVQA